MHRITRTLVTLAAASAALVPVGPAGADAGAGFTITPDLAEVGGKVIATEMTLFPEFVCGNTAGDGYTGPFVIEWKLVDVTSLGLHRPDDGTTPTMVDVQDGLPTVATGSSSAPADGASFIVDLDPAIAPGTMLALTGTCVDAAGATVFGYDYSTLVEIDGVTTTSTSSTTSSPATTSTVPAAPRAVAPATPATPTRGAANDTG